MRILFVHQNFPAQFQRLAGVLAQSRQHQVLALGMQPNPVPDGVELVRYAFLRTAASHHELSSEVDLAARYGEACAAAATALKQRGFTPDVVVAHSGWGEALFLRDVFPAARIVVYCEYHYAAEGQDVGFDPEMPAVSLRQRFQLRLRNTAGLLSLDAADAAFAPTQWQRDTFPAWARARIQVIHEGVALPSAAPALRALCLPSQHGSVSIAPGDEIVSYVARNLEPVRGFHILMRTLPILLRLRPHARVVIVGGDGLSYGAPPPAPFASWKAALLHEVGGRLDPGRVHFTGQLPYQSYLQLLQLSSIHLYWTVPFVLSWSFLEAALTGVPVLASATAPVREFAAELGVDTIDFFDSEGFARRASICLASGMRRTPSRPPRLSPDYCVAEQLRLIGITPN